MVRIAYIGAGNMASAMVRGLLRKNSAQPAEVACISADDGTGQRLSKDTGITWTGSYRELEDMMGDSPAGQALVLAVKPQQLKDLPVDARDLGEGRLLISILAGTRISGLRAAFPKAGNIVRAMPNTPGQIGAGITCYASESQLSAEEQTLTEAVLGAMGPAILVEEDQLDAVTAVSGSGPAYVFEFVAALRDAGVKEGLDPLTAYSLAVHTVLGSARLLLEGGEEPEVLRDRVTSPGGTTQAALSVLAEQGFRDLVQTAVGAARRRSIELGKQ